MDAVRHGDVLLVEDDHNIREALLDALAAEGYRVHCAANGREALSALKSCTPQLILLDLMMPVMDGWQFRSEQQRDPSLARIPVIVISADHRLKDKVSALAVDAFLAKPFELDTLLATVDRYCGEAAEGAGGRSPVATGSAAASGPAA